MRSVLVLFATCLLVLLTGCAEDETPATTIVADAGDDVIFMTDDVVDLDKLKKRMKDDESSNTDQNADDKANHGKNASLSSLHRQAIAGNSQAQLSYADALIAKEEPYSDKVAFYWISQAAQHQTPEAIYMLAYCYYAGIGTPVNYQQSSQYFYALAEANIPQAQYYLAKIYFEGINGQRNLGLAKQWVTRAMTAQLPEAKILAKQIYTDYEQMSDETGALVQVVEPDTMEQYQAIDASEAWMTQEFEERI